MCKPPIPFLESLVPYSDPLMLLNWFECFQELSDRLMCPQSALGAYVIDLMHDKNTAIREQCENALIIIGVSYREQCTNKLWGRGETHHLLYSKISILLVSSFYIELSIYWLFCERRHVFL